MALGGVLKGETVVSIYKAVAGCTFSGQVPTWRRWALRTARSKVADPIVNLLRKGVEPKQLALSAALGFTVGLFPIFGFTAALCGVVAFCMRSTCNVAVMMVANFVATPFEISMIVPFMRFGECLTGSPSLPISFDTLSGAIMGHNPGLLAALCHAVSLSSAARL
eukprot:TRINITY_DN13534_c0_g1_i1.p1 TRINITY_DN13534_c0_g1~~TRINITY_DN13534_c0_g1_i1.p1  ORF type:complete len:165 (+),score=22.59 TRINITY_DN13534_c0_g1_i1:194-688(+)